MMSIQLEAGTRVLNNRYRLLRPLSREADTFQGCETWLARDEDETEFLLKAWPVGTQSNPVLRAVWDRELRVLYRASSSAGADSCLLVVRDAQFDKTIGAFVLLSEGPGYETLAQGLRDRTNYPWLKSSDLKNRDIRSTLWKGLRQIAMGIHSLHSQQIIHRAVSPESVYLNLSDGPRSMRLGSFEWSVRVGVTSDRPPQANWSTPPEILEGGEGYTFDSDWFAFGMLVARSVVSVEGWINMDPIRRLAAVYREVGSASHISGRERDLICRLIQEEPRSRLAYIEEIVRQIDEIIASMRLPAGSNESRPLHLVVAATNTRLVDALCSLGFVPEHPPYSSRNNLHVAELREFVRNDVSGGLVYGQRQSDRCVLRGQRITLLLRPYQDEDGEASWDFAHVSNVVGLSTDEDNFRPIPLGEVTVHVLTPREVKNARGRGVRSWEGVIPRVDEISPLANALARFQDFLRCTNQLDLLLRDGEIAAYEVFQKLPTSKGREIVEIRESTRVRASADFCRLEGGVVELLQREIDSRKDYCDRVFLTVEDALLVRVDVTKDWWEIDTDFDMSQGTIRLSRSIVPGQAPFNDTGFLRSYGQYAAVTLIRRRTDAIARLQEHSYLLRALAQPGQVFMDTQSEELPHPLDLTNVDSSKMAVIKDVLRVRPIYALQGPPGTGKTTLVAHLLRQILTDDPVAQILVTAPGHSAVDVLRGKVRDEVFRDVPEIDKPLAVRLGRKSSGKAIDEGSVSNVTADLLKRVGDHLDCVLELSETQKLWRNLVRQMSACAGESRANNRPRVDATVRDLADTEELIKRSASITYCTTSAFDLEELAAGNQSFDWSIVEEAGKSHGFDLALPLQAGHRWLLLGDQFQLPPYRINDYARGLSQLGRAVDALAALPSQQLVDREWTNRWGRYTEQEQAEFQRFCNGWLRTFGTLFMQLRDGIFGEERMTVDHSVGAATGRLAVQYRMHPAIGTIISEAFYPDFGGIRNATEDENGEPTPEILHKIVEPIDLTGVAILWIDTPWCQHDPSTMEHGPAENSPRYTNPGEVRLVRQFLEGLQSSGQDVGEVAVLSPYTAQVRNLERALRDLAEARKLNFRQSIQRQGGVKLRAAHTVDSFQGNEADIVVVSMVRNNASQSGAGLGFMADDASRINVLLSRAQKLLVLVGSWDFFRTQVSHVPTANKEHELWGLRTALDQIEAAVQRGQARRISASEFFSGVEKNDEK